jgi:hypothetical protein
MLTTDVIQNDFPHRPEQPGKSGRQVTIKANIFPISTLAEVFIQLTLGCHSPVRRCYETRATKRSFQKSMVPCRTSFESRTWRKMLFGLRRAKACL